jgi:hypothetical protein
MSETQLIQSILKAREGVGKRANNNKTTQENVQLLKTIDIAAING